MRAEVRSQKSEAGMPETGKFVAPILRRPRESGGPLDPRLRGDDRDTLKRLAFRCGLLLTSVFWLLTPAFSATHVTGAYNLGANPKVMQTVNGAPQYGLVFAQRSKPLTYSGVQYGTQVLAGYLNASGQLNDGAGNLWLDLIPNTTASPGDSFYVVTINIQGSVHAEIWVVPEIATIDVASVRQSQPPSPTPPAVFYQFVEQSGADLTQRPRLNFLGTGVSCADNTTQLRTDCTFTAGGGSAPIASATVSGTVKTDAPSADPVVYLRITSDSLLAGKANSVHTHTESDVTSLVTDLAGKVPSNRLISATAPLAGGGSLAGDLTLSIPAATSLQNGYLASADWSTFNSKESALTFSSPLARSINAISCPSCEVTGNKNAASGYAGLTAASKLNLAQGQEVWSVTDLTDYTSVSGTGTAAIRSTITTPVLNDILTWNGTNWVNQAPGGVTNHNLLSATHPDTLAASPVLGDILFANATPAWAKLAGNITAGKKFLNQTGTGTVSASPSWDALAAADIPALDAAKITTGTFADAFLASAYSGVGTCTNQVVAALTRNAAPSCTTITSAFTSGTFAPNAHDVLSASHGDTTAGAVARGDVITGQTITPKWTRLGLGTTGKYLKSDGTDLVYSAGAASGVGACAANTFASTLNGDAAPTCTQPAFSNLAGTATKAQLPATTVYTDQSNTFTTGTQDASAATATLPVKTGTVAGAPATCTANKELYVETDATPAGQQVFLCNATGNGWNKVGDGGGGGGGITTLNTLTAATQVFAVPGTAGTAPAWSSSLDTHTLNIPLASTASVTAGLISKANFDTFNGKPDLVVAGTAGIGPSKVGAGTTAARSDHDHRSIHTLTWFFPGTPATGVQNMVLVFPEAAVNYSILNMRVTVNTTASTASAVNIQRCTALCTGTGPTFANIYSTDLSLASSTRTVAKGSAPDQNVTSLAAGDQFKANLVTVGTSLADVTLSMTVKYDTTN